MITSGLVYTRVFLGVLSCTTLVIAQCATRPSGGGFGAPPLGLDLFVPALPEHPPTAVLADLGERLFFDQLLSADRTLACASCHRPDHGFADVTAASEGVFGRRTTRNTPSLFNAAYGTFFFWDGRVQTLEEQVVQPISNPNEMGLPLPELVERLRARPEYREVFRAAFDGEATAENLARALASYVRTLRSGDSPADRYAAGDPDALDVGARAGFKLFRGKARCVECHIGPILTDERFHNTGVGWGGGDTGRFAITGDPTDWGRFNTPSLRNVALTAPYMHDGSMQTLETVVDFYDGGARPNQNLDLEIQPLQLTPEEKHQLVLYLRALTGSLHLSSPTSAPSRSTPTPQ